MHLFLLYVIHGPWRHTKSYWNATEIISNTTFNCYSSLKKTKQPSTYHSSAFTSRSPNMGLGRWRSPWEWIPSSWATRTTRGRFGLRPTGRNHPVPSQLGPLVLAAGNSWNASHMPGKRINKCKESGISRAVENSECTCVLSTAGLTIISDILGLSVGNTQVSGNLNGENERLDFGWFWVLYVQTKPAGHVAQRWSLWDMWHYLPSPHDNPNITNL